MNLFEWFDTFSVGTWKAIAAGSFGFAALGVVAFIKLIIEDWREYCNERQHLHKEL